MCSFACNQNEKVRNSVLNSKWVQNWGPLTSMSLGFVHLKLMKNFLKKYNLRLNTRYYYIKVFYWQQDKFLTMTCIKYCLPCQLVPQGLDPFGKHKLRSDSWNTRNNNFIVLFADDQSWDITLSCSLLANKLGHPTNSLYVIIYQILNCI